MYITLYMTYMEVFRKAKNVKLLKIITILNV